MQYTLLKDVSRQTYRWKVLVRLARTWEFRDQQTGEILYELDFVVVDRQGGMMEGLVPNNRIEQFRQQLRQGSVYIFEHFVLSDARKSYRAVEHPYRIRFTQRTRVNEVIPPPENFPVYAYHAHDFDVLATRAEVNTLLSDVVGLITALTEVTVSPITQQHKRQIFISDGSQRAIVTLWGNHAAAFDADTIQRASATKPMVALFVGMTVGQFSGMLAFKSTSATQWYINIPTPEIAMTKKNTKHVPHQIEWQGTAQPRGEPVDTTIIDLLADSPYDRIGERFRMKILITDIVTSENWWYLSCKSCWKKLVLDGDTYKCPRCSSSSGEPRYKLVLVGTDAYVDDTEEAQIAHFTFFGAAGTAITGLDAELLVPDVSTPTTDIPLPILSLVGKKYILTADLSDGSLDANQLCFQVNSSDPIYDEKVYVGQHAESSASGIMEPSAGHIGLHNSEREITPPPLDEITPPSSATKDPIHTPPDDTFLLGALHKEKSSVPTGKRKAPASQTNINTRKSGQKSLAAKPLFSTDEPHTSGPSQVE